MTEQASAATPLRPVLRPLACVKSGGEANAQSDQKRFQEGPARVPTFGRQPGIGELFCGRFAPNDLYGGIERDSSQWNRYRALNL